MKKQHIIIPLRSRSLTDDFLSADGEVDSASNLLPLSAYLPDKEGASTEIFHPDFLLPRVELPRVEVTLLRTTLPGWHIHPEEFPAKNVVSTDTSSEARGKCALSLLNSLRAEAAGRNLFTEPFLFLAAFRLKDGRHVSPTPPILLIPNSTAPLVTLSGNAEEEEMRLSVIAAICKLQVRITFPDDADYSDLPIAALDLFVTSPFSLYDSKTLPLAMRHIPFSGFTHSISPDGIAGEHPLFTGTVPAGWLPKATPGGEVSCAIASAGSFHRISSIPFKSLTPTTNFRDVVFNSGSPLSSPYPEYIPDYLHLSSVEKIEGAEYDGSGSFVNINVTPPSPLPFNLLTPYCNTAGYIPRFLFHPDPYATAYTFTSNGKGNVLPLQKHPSLYGSYLLRSLDAEGEYVTDADPDPYIPVARVEKIENSASIQKGEKTTLVSCGGEIYLRLRPLKLGFLTEGRRLISIGVRGNGACHNLRLNLQGSRNIRQWHEIASTESGDISRLWNAKFPFFQLTISGFLAEGETVSAVTVTIAE